MGRTVQQYNFESENWTFLTPSPMDIEYSACVLLPNKKILVLGSIRVANR